MKLKILAGPVDFNYEISGDVINGIDTSLFTEGSTFTGNEETLASGIYGMEWVSGELVVTIAQKGILYECQPINGGHYWHEAPSLIDVSEFDASQCYIVATGAPDGAQYVKRDDGWTVVLPEQEETA